MKIIIANIPTNEIINNKSAIFSNFSSFKMLLDFIDIKEKTDDAVKNNAMIVVNSSTKELAVLLAMCKEVITNKQNPKRFADVDNIC